eukprot:1141408-Alexandrium_andersonii.AAC.1
MVDAVLSHGFSKLNTNDCCTQGHGTARTPAPHRKRTKASTAPALVARHPELKVVVDQTVFVPLFCIGLG